MSRYTYAGDFVNPTSSWRIASKPDAAAPEGVSYFVECHRSEEKEVDGVIGTFSYWSPHTSGQEFSSVEDAEEYIEGIDQAFEEDYDDYLDENRYAIAQMERYEMWRNEQ